jgi:hypothetical protein
MPTFTPLTRAVQQQGAGDGPRIIARDQRAGGAGFREPAVQLGKVAASNASTAAKPALPGRVVVMPLVAAFW